MKKQGTLTFSNNLEYLDISIVFFGLILLLIVSVTPNSYCFAQDDLFGKPQQEMQMGQATPEKNKDGSIGYEIAPEGMQMPQEVLETLPLEAQPEEMQKRQPVYPPDTPSPPQREDGLDPEPTWVPIEKHFKFNEGRDLIPGPTPTPLIDVKAFVEDFKQKWIESTKNMPTEEELTKEILKNVEPPAISKCLEDKSESFQMSESFPEGLEGQKSPFQDMLFIEPKDFVEDADIVYGVTTILVPFVKEVPNKGWSYITEMGVPCLPFRMRLQGARVYVDQGLPALKNYSKNAKGEFHPYIKSLYKLEKSK
jgi:hypothetical protein